MIEVVKFIPKLVKFGILGLVLVSLNGKVTQAQRSPEPDGSIDLLSLSCSSSGQGELVTDALEDVSVGKQIFTPIFLFNNVRYDYNPFLLTCKLDPSEQQRTLQLMFGIEDYAIQEQQEITITIYIDGQATASHVITAGEGKTLLLDLTKANSIAIEASCSLATSSGTWCTQVHFLKASILPSPTSSLNNSNSTAFNNSENLDPFNNTGKTANPPLEESSWGNSTVGSEEETESTNSSSDSNTDDTVETINTIIDIFE
jgi:hypothetical protein